MAIAFPCASYVMQHPKRPMGKHHREPNGEPRAFEEGNAPGNAKRATAVGTDLMLDDVCIGAIN